MITSFQDPDMGNLLSTIIFHVISEGNERCGLAIAGRSLDDHAQVASAPRPHLPKVCFGLKSPRLAP